MDYSFLSRVSPTPTMFTVGVFILQNHVLIDFRFSSLLLLLLVFFLLVFFLLRLFRHSLLLKNRVAPFGSPYLSVKSVAS